MKSNIQMVPFDTRCWNGVVEGLEITFKGWMREVVEEVISEKMCKSGLEENLTTQDLCKRWNISINTLHNWEKDGKIAPLPLGGRKKLYSLSDVMSLEESGLIKKAC